MPQNMTYSTVLIKGKPPPLPPTCFHYFYTLDCDSPSKIQGSLAMHLYHLSLGGLAVPSSWMKTWKSNDTGTPRPITTKAMICRKVWGGGGRWEEKERERRRRYTKIQSEWAVGHYFFTSTGYVQLQIWYYTKRISAGAPIYLVDVIEYLAAEILELASNAAHDNKKQLPSAVGYQKRWSLEQATRWHHHWS